MKVLGDENDRLRAENEELRRRSRPGSVVGAAVIIPENEEITQAAPAGSQSRTPAPAGDNAMVVVTDMGEEERKRISGERRDMQAERYKMEDERWVIFLSYWVGGWG